MWMAEASVEEAKVGWLSGCGPGCLGFVGCSAGP